MKKIDDKGQMIITWIWIIVTFFVVIVIYIMLDQPLVDNLFETGRTMGVNTSTIDHLESAWKASPFIFFLALMLLGFLAALLSGRG